MDQGLRSTPLGQRGDEEAFQFLGRLKNLGLGWGRQLGAEDAVPEAAGDAEAVLVIGEVVLEVVLLECVPVGGEAVILVSMCNMIRSSLFDIPLVVQEVVRAVVADVSEDATAVYCYSSIPVVEEDGVGQLPEGCGEDEEEGGGHDKTQAVHGEVVVDSVEQEVCRDRHAVVG